jgi:hypothetical protein
MAIWYIYFVDVWCIFPRFGMMYQEKSGSPGKNSASPAVKLTSME